MQGQRERHHAQVRSGDVGWGVERTRNAAEPVQRTTSAEKTTGGGGKYFQVSAKLANCRPKNIQGSEPAAARSLRDNSPKCHATKAANKNRRWRRGRILDKSLRRCRRRPVGDEHCSWRPCDGLAFWSCLFRASWPHLYCDPGCLVTVVKYEHIGKILLVVFRKSAA